MIHALHTYKCIYRDGMCLFFFSEIYIYTQANTHSNTYTQNRKYYFVERERREMDEEEKHE